MDQWKSLITVMSNIANIPVDLAQGVKSVTTGLVLHRPFISLTRYLWRSQGTCRLPGETTRLLPTGHETGKADQPFPLPR